MKELLKHCSNGINILAEHAQVVKDREAYQQMQRARRQRLELSKTISMNNLDRQVTQGFDFDRALDCDLSSPERGSHASSHRGEDGKPNPVVRTSPTETDAVSGNESSLVKRERCQAPMVQQRKSLSCPKRRRTM